MNHDLNLHFYHTTFSIYMYLDVDWFQVSLIESKKENCFLTVEIRIFYSFSRILKYFYKFQLFGPIIQIRTRLKTSGSLNS